MSLKSLFLLLAAVSFPTFAECADVGFSAINQRHYIICGTTREYPYLAEKKDGNSKGFDVDICRAFAQSILQSDTSFKMVSVNPARAGEALSSGAVDVMLGHHIFSSAQEAQGYLSPVDTMYYDRLVFAARSKKGGASSMKDYAGAKVCVAENSPAYDSLVSYNTKYALGFSYLKFPLLSALKEAFYLRRCDLLAGDEVFVTGVVKDLHSDEAAVLPEEFGTIAVKSYVSGANNTLAIALRAVINALKLAAQLNINSSNLEAFALDSSPSVRNLLGQTPQYWQKLGLDTGWVSKYIADYGNYSLILERNLGTRSALGINMSRNLPYSEGGLLTASPLF